MGKTYRTMQGRQIDMEKLRAQNELMPAVGNMKVNARGDEIGPGGKILRTREQIMGEYYEANPNATPTPRPSGQRPSQTPPWLPTPAHQLPRNALEPPHGALPPVAALPRRPAARTSA